MFKAKFSAAFVGLIVFSSATLAKPTYISGAPLPSGSNYKAVAEAKITERLKDPESAKINWGEPFKISCSKGVFQTPKRWLGWAIMVDVNAKNSYGGYTGAQPMTVLLANDGTEDIVHVPYANNIWKFGLCKRDEWK